MCALGLLAQTVVCEIGQIAPSYFSTHPSNKQTKSEP